MCDAQEELSEEMNDFIGEEEEDELDLDDDDE